MLKRKCVEILQLGLLLSWNLKKCPSQFNHTKNMSKSKRWQILSIQRELKPKLQYLFVTTWQCKKLQISGGSRARAKRVQCLREILARFRRRRGCNGARKNNCDRENKMLINVPPAAATVISYCWKPKEPFRVLSIVNCDFGENYFMPVFGRL